MYKVFGIEEIITCSISTAQLNPLVPYLLTCIKTYSRNRVETNLGEYNNYFKAKKIAKKYVNDSNRINNEKNINNTLDGVHIFSYKINS